MRFITIMLKFKSDFIQARRKKIEGLILRSYSLLLMHYLTNIVIGSRYTSEY